MGSGAGGPWPRKKEKKKARRSSDVATGRRGGDPDSANATIRSALVDDDRQGTWSTPTMYDIHSRRLMGSATNGPAKQRVNTPGTRRGRVSRGARHTLRDSGRCCRSWLRPATVVSPGMPAADLGFFAFVHNGPARWKEASWSLIASCWHHPEIHHEPIFYAFELPAVVL